MLSKRHRASAAARWLTSRSPAIAGAPRLGRLARLLGLRSRRLPVREAYELWADAYPPWPHNPLMEIEQAVVTPMLASITASRALDIGTGTGRYLPLLGATGARLVVGIDMSMAMLRSRFRTKRDTGRAPLVCGDGCRLPFADASFDLVCASLMVGDVEDLAAWVDEVARVLTAGGHVVYSDFHPAASGGRMRRTFASTDGRRFELGYFAHPVADHLSLLVGAGFIIKTIREPRFPDRRAPEVVVLHAVKSSRRQSRGADAAGRR